MSLSKLKSWVNKNSLVLFFISVYFLLSVIKIQYPGVNNDQLMFVNTATFNPDNFFLWKSWHGIPMMVFPYIGALKSYLYMPIFHFFGVNILSIRLPQIILICITWWILYKALSIAFNKKVALVTILFLSLDPSIIAYSKIDQGPTVLEFFFKILAVCLFFLFVSTKKKIYFLGIFPVLALGIFNKLNFIWFVNAFMVSTVFLYWPEIYKEFKRFGRLAPFVIVAGGYFMLAKLFLRISKEVTLSYKDFTDPVAFSNLFNNLQIFYNNLFNIINGNILFKTMYGKDPTELGGYFSTFIFLLLFAGMGYAVIKHKLSKHHLFFISVIGFTIFQLLLTKKAISAWHALAIYPFFTAVLALSILQIKRIANFLIVSIVVYEILVNLSYISQYSKPTKAIAYSSSIYSLIDFAKGSNAKFICLDVDICNQLLSFNQGVNKYKEPFFYLDPPTYNYSFIKLNDTFSKPNDYLFVAHGDLQSHFPELKKQFFSYLAGRGINYKRIKELKDGEVTAFEVYKVGL